MADLPRERARPEHPGAVRVRRFSTELLFFGLEWAAVDDDHAERVLADAAVDEYRHWLEALRRYRPHLLTEPEERILTEKSVRSSSAWSRRLYLELLSGLRVDLDGGEQSMEVTAPARLQDADRDVRRVRPPRRSPRGLRPGLRTRAFMLQHDPA